MTDQVKDPEYPDIDLRREIDPDMPADRAAALLLADMATKDAQAARDNPSEREPVTVDAGFSLAIETADGIIGLWSCWLKDQFFLGFPKEWELPAELIATHMGPAAYRGTIGWRPYENSDETQTNGRWGDGEPWYVWGDIRVPLNVDAHSSSSHSFHVIQGREMGAYPPPRVMYGWGVGDELRGGDDDGLLYPNTGRRIMTTPFYQDADDPDGWKDRLQQLKPRFISLMCALANEHTPAGITAELGFVGVPEQFEAALGYELEWLRGERGTRQGWDNEVVYGQRANGLDEIMLVSKNSLVPWSCYRRLPLPEATPEALTEMLTL